MTDSERCPHCTLARRLAAGLFTLVALLGTVQAARQLGWHEEEPLAASYTLPTVVNATIAASAGWRLGR